MEFQRRLADCLLFSLRNPGRADLLRALCSALVLRDIVKVSPLRRDDLYGRRVVVIYDGLGDLPAFDFFFDNDAGTKSAELPQSLFQLLACIRQFHADG